MPLSSDCQQHGKGDLWLIQEKSALVKQLRCKAAEQRTLFSP